MKNDSSTLSHEESMAIITQMIDQAKGNVRGSSFHFLLWGWVVTFANLGHFYLMYYTDFERPYMIWLITIPAWITSMVYGYRQGRKETVRTYSSNLIMWVWLGFSFSILIVIFGIFGPSIPSVILIFAGFATFMSGLILRFKPIIIGGSSFWLFAVLAFAVPHYSLVISAIAVLFGYLIPGYMLRKAE